jgi:oligopeptide transport system substrate-binding protein
VGADGIICRILWEGLTVSHPSTLEPLPGMAHRWEMSPDGLVYTFHLRQARWSDGRPVTAGDFLYAWRRVLNPETAARYAGQLYYLRNAEAYNKKRISDPAQVGVAAPDDSTLVVTLEHPTPYFLDLLSFYTFMPVPRCHVQHGDRWSRPATWATAVSADRLKPANYFV